MQNKLCPFNSFNHSKTASIHNKPLTKGNRTESNNGNIKLQFMIYELGIGRKRSDYFFLYFHNRIFHFHRERILSKTTWNLSFRIEIRFNVSSSLSPVTLMRYGRLINIVPINVVLIRISLTEKKLHWKNYRWLVAISHWLKRNFPEFKLTRTFFLTLTRFSKHDFTAWLKPVCCWYMKIKIKR